MAVAGTVFCNAPRREDGLFAGSRRCRWRALIQYVRRAAKDANSSRLSRCGEGGKPATHAAAASLSRTAQWRA
jgi:hypothetical protein